MKVFPVVATCRAESEKIKATARECLAEVFKGLRMFTYEVTIKVRNCTGLTKSSVLPLINNVISELNLPCKVKFGSSDYVISVDILKSLCCISVMKDFMLYKKYNLHEIAMSEKVEPPKTAPKRPLGEGCSGGSAPKRRNSDEGEKKSSTAVKQEPVAAPDPFMSKIAGLIQTKMTKGPNEDSTDGKLNEVLKVERDEEIKESDSKSAFSLTCPYVASSI